MCNKSKIHLKAKCSEYRLIVTRREPRSLNCPYLSCVAIAASLHRVCLYDQEHDLVVLQVL